MNAPDITADALAKLKIHEKAIGRLYQTYAERFPEQGEFWSRLSREEEQHAQWIETLQGEMRDDPASLVTNRFPVAAIEHSIAVVEKLVLKASSPDFTPINAISAALNLEQGLLENKYFDVFETDKAKMKGVLELLKDKTRSHHAMVQRAWQNTRQSIAEPA